MNSKNITIEEFDSFECLESEKWNELLARSPSATVFQSWEWLNAWWETFGCGKLWIVCARNAKALSGAAALYIDESSTLRFVGQGHADYGQMLYAQDEENTLNALVEHIFERSDKWKHAELSCVLAGCALADRLLSKGAWVSSKMASPRVLFEEKSAASLLGKSSLKRHAKKLASLGPVTVEHLDSSEQIQPVLDAFFLQHQERWALTRSPSLFLDQQNQRFYRKLAEQAVTDGRFVLTRVLLNGKDAAMHFGFRSQQQLIWYKPTYDPRLSHAGPGEVLIAELIKKCVVDGLRGLDFTRGDESFKLRFASEIREVLTFEVASKFWLKQLELNRHRLKDAAVAIIDKAHLHRAIATVVHNARATMRVIRSKGIRAACIAAKERMEQHGPRHVDVFIRTANDCAVEDERISVHTLETLNEILATFDVTDPEHLEVLSDTPVYLEAGARLWVAKCSGSIVSCGWELRGTGVDVTEIRARLHFPSTVVCLMEFRTFSKHQRKGYYAALLKSISASEGTDHQLIYALSHNIASVRAIRKAGFEHAGRVTRSVLGALRFKLLSANAALSATPLQQKK